MKVLVIVVLYNGTQWIERCLNSAASWDILVIDNNSTDGGGEFIKSHFPNVRLIQSKENLGFGAANNIGLSISIKESYDFVYLLNQDAWLEGNTIERLIASWTSKYGILSPLQCAKDGTLDKNFQRKCEKYLQRGSSASLIEVPFVMAAHWLISVDVVKTVGGFSPAFNQYVEDDNYIDRLHYWGYKVAIVPAVVGIHDRSDRASSKQKRIRLKCIASIARVSNPCREFVISAIVEPIRLVATAVKNLSIEPLTFIPKFVKRYGEFKRYRAASIHKSAFL